MEEQKQQKGAYDVKHKKLSKHGYEKIARQLGYDKSYIDRIKAAKDDIQISQIMMEARINS